MDWGLATDPRGLCTDLDKAKEGGRHGWYRVILVCLGSGTLVVLTLKRTRARRVLAADPCTME